MKITHVFNQLTLIKSAIAAEGLSKANGAQVSVLVNSDKEPNDPDYMKVVVELEVGDDEKTVKARIDWLEAKWHDETCILSNLQKIVDHPAYQEIIGIGWPAVPVLLRKLETKFDHWSYALRKITGVEPEFLDNPTSDEVSRAWVELGKKKGWI